MSSTRSFQRPLLDIPSVKHQLLSSITANGSGALSPDIRPNCPPNFLISSATTSSVKRIGKYLLSEEIEQTGPCQQCTAIHVEKQTEFVCKVIVEFLKIFSNDLMFMHYGLNRSSMQSV